VFAVYLVLSVLALPRIVTAQPAISMEHDPISGKTRTFLAGEVKVPQSWNDSDFGVDNRFLACSLVPGLKSGQTIATQGSDDQSWSVQTVPMVGNDTTGQYPMFSMIKVLGEKEKRIVLPGRCTVKSAIKAGAVLRFNGEPSYHIDARRNLEAGEVIPVLRIAPQSFVSIEEVSDANTTRGAQPLLTVLASGDNQRAVIEVWRVEQLHSHSRR